MENKDRTKNEEHILYKKLFKEIEILENKPDSAEIPLQTLDLSSRRCPECGTELIESPYRNLVGEGVGITVSIPSKNHDPGEETVCPNCGLVFGDNIRKM